MRKKNKVGRLTPNNGDQRPPGLQGREAGTAQRLWAAARLSSVEAAPAPGVAWRGGCPGVGERPEVRPAACLHPLPGSLGFRLEQEEPCTQEAELGQK